MFDDGLMGKNEVFMNSCFVNRVNEVHELSRKVYESSHDDLGLLN